MNPRINISSLLFDFNSEKNNTMITFDVKETISRHTFSDLIYLTLNPEIIKIV